MEIPIISGVYSDNTSDIRTGYPVNLVPILKDTGVATGYLRPAEGIVECATTPGIDRGGINWNGKMYRVSGTKLVVVNEDYSVTTIGDVGGSGFVTFDYSFDYLAIASSGLLYLYNGTTLQQVTDPDLGTVVDVQWVDGYFMTTDGEFLVVTELTDPFAVNPLKYGSSEADPDPVVALVKLKNEIYAINRNTIEVFNNVGGTNFPFARVEGAQVQKGAIGTHAACVFGDGIAFVGGGRNESPAVWITAGGTAQKISSREVEIILAGYPEVTLSGVLAESRLHDGVNQLYIHLPGQTLVYDMATSAAMQKPIWFVLSSSIAAGAYLGRNAIWCYNQWFVGHPYLPKVGYLTKEVSSHWGSKVRWEVMTPMFYNGAKGAIIHDMELVSLTGRSALGDDSTVFTSYSLDGVTWSIEWGCKAGKLGDRSKRIAWRRCGGMEKMRIQRFRGTSDAHISILRLEATLEPLLN